MQFVERIMLWTHLGLQWLFTNQEEILELRKTGDDDKMCPCSKGLWVCLVPDEGLYLKWEKSPSFIFKSELGSKGRV